MTELPEVEVIRQSLDKKIKQKKVKKVIVRNKNLRFKIPDGFPRYLENLFTFIIFLPFKNMIKFEGIFDLKFLFLTITFFTSF